MRAADEPTIEPGEDDVPTAPGEEQEPGRELVVHDLAATVDDPDASTDEEDAEPEPRWGIPAAADASEAERAEIYQLNLDRFSGRLLTREPKPSIWGWLGPALVTALGAVMRLLHLAFPHSLVFDETYYVKQAYTLLTVGYDAKWPENPNPAFEAGALDTFLKDADYVVHPPVGKWMIAAGEWLFGPSSSFGWRFATAVVGIAAIWMVARIGRRLFGSNLIGILAGLFMAVDGVALVMSRTGILDNFVMFWALAAFGAVLLDRYRTRARLAERTARMLADGREIGSGPGLGFRPWLLAAGVFLGLCCGTKWSGIYFVAAFGLMVVFWDYGARRAVGVKHWIRVTTYKDGLLDFALIVPTAIVTYVASWTMWFVNANSYMHNWAAENPGEGIQWLPPVVRSWLQYHANMWDFHNHLTSTHTYMSKPWGWLIQQRPTSFFYVGDSTACPSGKCAEAITSVGNPLIWWGAIIAIGAALVAWAWWRDWRPGAALCGLAAGYLPWFMYSERTIYTFYTVAFVPFVVLLLAYGVGLVIGPRDATDMRRRTGWMVVLVYLALVLGASAFWWPIWTGELVDYSFWQAHMWLKSWI